MISNIPNLVYLAPTTFEEQVAMMDYAINQTERPIAIRVPEMPLVESGERDTTDYSQLNKYEVLNEGEKVAILGLGNFRKLGEDVAANLKANHNIEATVINPKFITGVDTDLMDDVAKNHDLVITIEDGQIDGGFGARVVTYLADKDVKAKAFGLKKAFVDRYDLDELLKANNLTADQIVDYVVNQVK